MRSATASASSDALSKAFEGPLGARLRAIDPDRSGNPDWVAYNAKFYERRVTVPLAAAALTPVAGDRAILDVSLAGYVVAVLALFWLLLLLRFRLVVAAGVTLATIFLPGADASRRVPAHRQLGPGPGDRRLRRCRFRPAPRPALAARGRPRSYCCRSRATACGSPSSRPGSWPLFQRSRPTLWLAVSGVAAALPAMLAVTVPMRELLAQMLNGVQPAPDHRGCTIAGHYPRAIVDLLQADGGYVRDGAWYSALYLLAGLALLFVLGRGAIGRPATLLMLGGALAGVAVRPRRAGLQCLPARARARADGRFRTCARGGATVACPVWRAPAGPVRRWNSP